MTGFATVWQVDALEDEGRYKEAEAVAAATVREQLSDALRHMVRDSSGSSEGGNALIIDGKALVHALADDCRAALLAVRGTVSPQETFPGSQKLVL